MTDQDQLKADPIRHDHPRTGGFLCLGCLGGDHGEDCWGRSCPCRCRAVLGLLGPFGYDPTAIGWDVGDPDEEGAA